ncbi:MAG: Xaa-Pro peptidase family protein [Bryobacteraceae bacterium]|nr:Xaa-Pro peptidase family protein [Bryobacteraceae bacterium]MDW8380065.1 Xaa-Pro peptidase family protein [Bryobacterales bacterium]
MRLFPRGEFLQRQEWLASALPAQGLDAILITHLPNIRYLTGFTGSNAFLLVEAQRITLYTDPRYTVQAAQEAVCRVVTLSGSTLIGVGKALHKRRIRRLGFERNHLSFASYDYLRGVLPVAAEFKPVANLVETRRMVKSEAELAAIRRAVETNSAAFDRALKKVRATMRESDLAAEIDYQMRKLGAEGPSFETIVAAGERAALPHARPSSNSLLSNQLLLIDMGATKDGYTSDMTRTVFVGSVSPKWKKRYGAVLEAQLAALAVIRAGVKAAQVDQAARKVLKSHGLDRAFMHSTGHGLGLEIHEAPRLGKKETAVLEAGMVLTVEPGIYLEGEGGVRIEDTVVVTPAGCQVLTPTPKDLTIV